MITLALQHLSAPMTVHPEESILSCLRAKLCWHIICSFSDLVFVLSIHHTMLRIRRKDRRSRVKNRDPLRALSINTACKIMDLKLINIHRDRLLSYKHMEVNKSKIRHVPWMPELLWMAYMKFNQPCRKIYLYLPLRTASYFERLL